MSGLGVTEMPQAVGNAPVGHAPTAAEITAAVERMIVSDVFSRSPQLGAFLRFVTQATLQGKSDRIKAYTIGLEVLRRDTSFDPQIDPIVRVEATRLRRAIERYYAGPGQQDAIIIDLPRGSYVPTFRRRESAAPPAILISDVGRLPQRLRRIAIPAAVGAAIVVVAVAIYVMGDFNRPADIGAVRITRNVETRRSVALPPGNGMPVVRFEPIRVIGAPPQHSVTADRLQAKIADAFARFDTINVSLAASDATMAAAPSNYVLSSAVEYAGDSAAAWFTLTSTAESKVVWSGTFENIQPPGGEGVTEDAVVVSLTNSLLQSYGVIRARDRAIHLASSAGDPRYRCVLQAADSMRTAEREAHELARVCLEHLTALDPSFAVGFTFLAMIYNREFQLEYPAHPGDTPPLDRALKAARQSIALQPESSRGHLALMIVQFNRRDIAAALETGKRSFALNKYDMLALGEYGGRLLMAGEIEKGMRKLREAGANGGARAAWHHIYLFIGSYMAGDMAEAIRHAGDIPTDNMAIGQVAQVLAAHAAGKPDEAKKAIDRLGAIAPGWISNPERQLSRIVADRAIVDRLSKGLAAAGIPGGS
jgi:tetratricopeptide (TPR) repeat protein